MAAVVVEQREEAALLIHGVENGMAGIVRALQTGEIRAMAVAVHAVGAILPAEAAVEPDVGLSACPPNAGRTRAGHCLPDAIRQPIGQARQVGVVAGRVVQQRDRIGAVVGVSTSEDDAPRRHAGLRREARGGRPHPRRLEAAGQIEVHQQDPLAFVGGQVKEVRLQVIPDPLAEAAVELAHQVVANLAVDHARCRAHEECHVSPKLY